MAYHEGDVVWTKYGAGVIVGLRGSNENDYKGDSSLYMVRLWRYPGKSIGSAALAYLDSSMVRGLRV